jgi:hypothetical protein
LHLVSHFGSGFVFGSVLAPFVSRRLGVPLLHLPTIIAVGTVLPDIDGVSVFFNHAVYYNQSWYSHHGCLHSLFGIIPCSLLFGLIITRVGKNNTLYRFPIHFLLVFAALYIGNIVHLAEDLPTPSGPWGGLMIWWPFTLQRFGGWSHIWWLNEYLMAVSILGLLSSFTLLRMMTAWPTRANQISVILIASDVILLVCLVRFVIVSRYITPLQWQEYQKGLLGESFYTYIRSLNDMLQGIWIREIL